MRSTISWNANLGRGMYNDPVTKTQYEITGFSGIIVDPNWICVTGKEIGGLQRKVRSNITKPGPDEFLRVVYTWNVQTQKGIETKYDVIATGKWADIKEEVTLRKGQYTKVCVVYAVKMTVYDPTTQVTTDVPLKQLVQFRMRGMGNVESWNRALQNLSSFSATEWDYRNLDGVFISLDGAFPYTSVATGNSSIYPSIKLMVGDTSKDGQKAMIAQAGQMYAEVQAYFKAMTAERLSASLEDTPTTTGAGLEAEYNKSAPSLPQESAPANSVKIGGVEIDSTDDDLPF